MNFPMKWLKAHRFWLLLFLVVVPSWVSADCWPRKHPNRLLYDEAHWLLPAERAALEETLRAQYFRHHLQMVVVITDTLCGMDIAQYANLLGERWGVGSKERDNGIVLVIVPKKANRKGQVFLAPGRGIQGDLTDALAKRIVETVMIPRFRQNERAAGILAGIQAVTQVLNGQAVPQKEGASKRIKTLINIGIRVFILVFILLVIFLISLLAVWLGGTVEEDGDEEDEGTVVIGTTDRDRSSKEEPTISFGGGHFNGGGAGGSW